MFPVNNYRSSRNSYQIKPTDTNLQQVATNMGLDYNQLAEANPAISSVSTGQFINLPSIASPMPRVPSPTTPTGGFLPVGKSSIPAPQVSSPVVPSVAPTANDRVSTNGYNPYISPSYNPSNYKAKEFRDIEMNRIANLSLILASAQNPQQLPPSINQRDVYTMGFTPQDMIAAGYKLERGSYVKDPNAELSKSLSTGTPRGGATPFGTNVSGQRLDASGNVWDPKTATRDIYGDRFKQVGAKEWRVINGKRQKVILLGGGKVITEAELRRKRGNNRPAPVREGTPSVTLDLVLGT